MKKSIFLLMLLFVFVFVQVHLGQGTSTAPSAASNEAKQAAASPAEAKPTEAKPTEAKPTEAKPTEAKPTEAKPTPATTQAASKKPVTPPPPAWGPRLYQVTSWLSLGADVRVRWEYHNNAMTLNGNAPNHEYNYQRYRLRLGGAAKLSKSFEINFRGVMETRSYAKPDSIDGYHPDDILFDTLNVTWKNMGGKPLTLTLGRQDMTFGNGWLVLDGTPGDGSRTIFFDAARLTYDLKSKKTTIDFVGICNGSKSDRWLPVIHPDPSAYARFPRPLTEQNENGAIAYVSNKSLAKTTLDGYFIYKHDSKVLANGNNGDTYAFGARAERDLSDHWRYRFEAAPEFGNKNGRDLRAFGVTQRLTYSLKDKKNQRIQFGYDYLSGDDPDTKDVNEGFDMLWGRWPQWTEVYLYNMASETRVGDYTNVQRLDVGWACTPVKNLDLSFDYMPLFAASNPKRILPGYSQNGKFRGNMGQAVLRYKFNDHVNGHLWGEFYAPGSYYSLPKGDTACFLRAEMIVRW